MSIREYIVDIFENEYLLAKINNLTAVKGIESDLRFLFEQSFFLRSGGEIPETEVNNRTDLKLPLDPVVLIEMKCYDGVLSMTTQKEIKKDLSSLSKKESKAIRIFIYFGLYGKTQLPKCEVAFVPANRLEEIKNEIEKIYELSKTESVEITGHEYYDKVLPDRILYAAWFHLK